MLLLTRRLLTTFSLFARGATICLVKRVEFRSKLITVALQSLHSEAPDGECNEDDELAPVQGIHPIALFLELIIEAHLIAAFPQEEVLPDKHDKDGEAYHDFNGKTGHRDYFLESLLLYALLRSVCDHRNLKKRSQKYRIDELHCVN